MPCASGPTRDRRVDRGSNLRLRQLLRQIGQQQVEFSLFLVDQVRAAGPTELLDRVPALLDQLVDDREHGRVVGYDAFIHFLLLDRRLQQADRTQASRILGAHRTFHVLGDAVLETGVRSHFRLRSRLLT
jgi:hypothetical protein